MYCVSCGQSRSLPTCLTSLNQLHSAKYTLFSKTFSVTVGGDAGIRTFCAGRLNGSCGGTNMRKNCHQRKATRGERAYRGIGRKGCFRRAMHISCVSHLSVTKFVASLANKDLAFNALKRTALFASRFRRAPLRDFTLRQPSMVYKVSEAKKCAHTCKSAKSSLSSKKKKDLREGSRGL